MAYAYYLYAPDQETGIQVDVRKESAGYQLRYENPLKDLTGTPIEPVEGSIFNDGYYQNGFFVG
ncbi:hypothetical protein BED65_15200 [Listeria monocytogenes]|nr:hypothetical protein [Listeria monocytogenes]